MSLFGRQYKEGKGVRKNEPEKKPFFRFWELFGRKFWNLISLNLLYLLMCLPIVTIGPATAAFTYVMRNYVLGRPVFLKDDFFETFKRCWKQSAVVWLVQTLVTGIDIFAIYFYYSAVCSFKDVKQAGFYINMAGLVISLSIFIILLFMSFYIYLMLVSFDFKLKSLFKNSFFFAGIGLKANLINLGGMILFFLIGIVLVSIRYVLPLGIMYFLLLTMPFCGFLAMFTAFPLVKKHVIDPYYEENGLPNPLDPKEPDEDEAIFQDDVTQKYEEEQLKAELEEKWGRKPDDEDR